MVGIIRAPTSEEVLRGEGANRPGVQESGYFRGLLK